jgi:hypothetical protein
MSGTQLYAAFLASNVISFPMARNAEHTEPIFPCFPYFSHIAHDSRSLTPFEERHPVWLIASADMQRGCLVFPRSNHRLIGRNESKEEHHDDATNARGHVLMACVPNR